jgi:hypothetical protein
MPSSRSLAFAFVVATTLSTTFATSTAMAEGGEASDHHRAGVAYAKSGKWEQAVREFEEAYKLDPTALRLYDVAQVSLQAKQYVRARDAYVKVIDSPALSSEQQQRARAALATAKASIGRVRIAIVGAKPGDVVTVDGTTPRGATIDVDAGKHTVKLVRDGETSEATVDVAAGSEATATLGEKKKEPPRPSTQPGTEPASDAAIPTATWIFGGIAIVALGVGVPLAVSGHLEYSRIKSSPCGQTETCDGEERPAMDRALAGDIIWISGALSAGVALFFYLTADKPSAPKPASASGIQRIAFGPVQGGGLIRFQSSF